MVTPKGALLEEVVRAYFARQGFYVLRSVPFRFEDNDVTDIDVWLYARQSASARIRGIVDVKNKKSPKAFERVIWVKGLQSILNCDRATIATTDNSVSLAKFANSQKVAFLSKQFLDRVEKRVGPTERLTLEEFEQKIQSYPAHKVDGDWMQILRSTKSAVVSLKGFTAFNKAMLAFRFFSERAEVRVQHNEIAIRSALLTAGIACIALDAALEKFTFEDAATRVAGIMEGVTYGDGDNRAKQSIETALAAIAEGTPNGRALAANARQHLDHRFSEMRADIIAEHFARDTNSQPLFNIAKELDEAAHAIWPSSIPTLSIEARTALGIFADFCRIKRSSLPIGTSHVNAPSADQPLSFSSSTLVKEVADEFPPSQQPLI